MPDLPDRIRAMKGAGRLKFSVCNGIGCITGIDEATLRTLCEIYNKREEIADKLEKLNV